MMQTTMRMLGELANVGKAPVTIRLNCRLFHADIVREHAERYGDDLTAGSPGEVIVAAAGTRARETLRRFTNDLLAAIRDQE
jgi:hypothetical protein